MLKGYFVCYTYNISSNNFTLFQINSNHYCGEEPIDINVEYFPERKEFVFICKSNVNFEFYLARLSIEGIFEDFYTPFYLINGTCGYPYRFNLFYSSKNQKYSIFTDTPCQTVYYFNSINASKEYDYPIDEPFFPFLRALQ